MDMAKSRKRTPVPVKRDARICFSIAYFTSEADAQRYAVYVQQQGYTYNGGWFDGMPCGREEKWDYTDGTHGKLYAVTE